MSTGEDTAINWMSIWEGVSVALAGHWSAGRGRLLTEDTVRFETVLALQQAGVEPERISTEVLTDGLGRGKLDLAVDGPGGAIVEFKYPRDSRTGISPDTMTLGELMRDFLRMTLVSADDRWVVQVLNRRMQKYLMNVANRYEIRWALTPGSMMRCDRAAVAGLPTTARTAMGDVEWRFPMTARCETARAVTDDLGLFAYRVEASVAAMTAPPPLLDVPETPTHLEPAALVTRGGARGEILDAVDRLTTRMGRDWVGLQELVDELRRSKTLYAESTIRTMVTSHMCRDAQGKGIQQFDDLERVGRGLYRRSSPGR